MSYAIYKTEAIVLRLIPSGEATLDAVLFTREFGKITVRAQSARKHESKMRMFLTRFRIVTVDLIKGKTIWRLTGITGDSIDSVFSDEQRLRPMYRIMRLAEFLIQGESPHVELFEFLKHLMTLPSRSQLSGLEVFGVIKVLEYLGYWNGESYSEIAIDDSLEACIQERKELVKKINESISATQIMVY